MSRILKAWEELSFAEPLSLVSAEEIRQRTGQEPRLMMKFDHSAQLPQSLKRRGQFILPLRNGLYAILQGQGYHRPEPCPPVRDLPLQTTFPLGTSHAGLSEMQHLDMAFNSGMLCEFLGEPILYPTIRGRKRSPAFRLQVGEHDLEVEGVQVEIDGGYEGRHGVAVVEAKIGECEDFHLRQIYYPYRFWSQHTTKAVRPVFFTYDPTSQVYRLREYRFTPPEVYQTPQLVRAAAYRLVESVPPSRALPLHHTVPVPQADRLERVGDVPLLVALGYQTPQELAERLQFEPRQGAYYLDAACALGLLERHPYRLSEPGHRYVTALPGERRALLARAVLEVPQVNQVLMALLLAPQGRLARREMEELLQRANGLSPSTARRRTQTLWSWLHWVSEQGAHFWVDQETLTLQLHRAAPNQLELFPPGEGKAEG